MQLTEPQGGSELGPLRTRAERAATEAAVSPGRRSLRFTSASLRLPLINSKL
jgi:hypothetical protein